MTRKFCALLPLTILLIFTRGSSGQGSVSKNPAPSPLNIAEILPENEALTPDPDFIDAIAFLFKSGLQPSGEAPSDKLSKENVEKCRQLIRKNPAKFVLQILIYSSGKGDTPAGGGAVSTNRGMAAMLLLKAFEADIPVEAEINAIMPLLKSKDPDVKHFVDLLRGRIERSAPQRSFTVYEDFLLTYAVRKVPAPRPLLEMMLRDQPGPSILIVDLVFPSSVSEPQRRRQIRWAEHVVGDYMWKKENGRLEQDAEKNLCDLELQNLLLSVPDWWAHLYVAQVLDKDKDLRSPKLIELLSKDNDEAVSSLVKKW